MGKRKAKPLLAVQGVVHLSQSFVQPSQESGLLTTVGGPVECQGLILAPNYGYAIAASELAKQAEDNEGATKGTLAGGSEELMETDEKSDENIENVTPTMTNENLFTDDHTDDLSIAQLVRHIGGAKDKPFRRNDIVEDRPESERPQEPVVEDDPETAKFYKSLGIPRPSAAKTKEVSLAKELLAEIQPSTDSLASPSAPLTEEELAAVPESIAEYYKQYPTEYVYSVPSDPYGSHRLEFNLPTIPYPDEPTESDLTIVDIARRAQKAKREYEAKKEALEKAKKKGEEGDHEEEEEAYDPSPMEVIPVSKVTGPKESNLTTYWEYVQVNPHDFNRWSFLISFVERTNLLNEIRKVYSVFLPLYPNCFGYWKRYSDIEKGHNYFQRALTILQRGLEFIPLSIDLWMSYLTLFAEIHAHDKNFETLLRQQYDFAINRTGMEFRSDTVWESFIQWEMNLEKPKNAFTLYKRLLQVPTRLYNRHWDDCKVLIRDYHPRDFLTHDDYESLRRKGCKILGFRYKPEPEIEPGEIHKTKKPEDKLMDWVKERVIEKLSKVQAFTAVEADKRWDFEDKIKRPYFHVKALDKGQLWNWESYLNFEISEGNHNRIVLLFERCLIPCAYYERFWCKYARYLEKYHRKHPQEGTSTHLQQSHVNLEIVSKHEADAEEEIVQAVESILVAMVDKIVTEEADEVKEIETLMEFMLGTLDNSELNLDRVMVTDVTITDRTQPCDNSLVPITTELTQDSNPTPTDFFTALIHTPKFPPSRFSWHDMLRDVYKRAALIHCPKKPMIRLQWAAFEEEIDNVKESRELISYVLEWYPNFLEGRLQLVDLERRTNNKEEVIGMYENLLRKTKGKEGISVLSMKFARFLFKEMGFPEKALQVLRTALKKDNGNPRLYAQVYEICYHRFPSDRKGAFAALELASRSEKLTPEQKLVFARKRTHFFQEHADLERYRNALDDLYDLESLVKRKAEEDQKWKDFQTQLAAQRKDEVFRSLQPFPVPHSGEMESGQKPIPISYDLDHPNDLGTRPGTTVQNEMNEPIRTTDVGPSLPYSQVPPVHEFLDVNYGYGGNHPDVKLAANLAHKEYDSIESQGYPATVKDTPEDLEVLRERKRKNPLYIIPPRGSYYVSANTGDGDVPGLAKKLRLEAPVLLSELITPNSSPCVNVPDWFVQDGGELCLSETGNGFSVLRYWPHFLSQDGNMKMFTSLRKSVKWHQKQILTSYGSWRHIPRLVSWLGPCEYSHTGMVMPKCENWTPEILDLLHRLVQLVNYEFNSCSLNLYRTGHDSNAWHADIHPALGSNPPIASVSLGALRTFEMKRKGVNSTNFIRFPLFPGSLLIMEGATQADWLHQVPKEPATKAERLNLTFRIMHALTDEDPFGSKEKQKEGQGSCSDKGQEIQEPELPKANRTTDSPPLPPPGTTMTETVRVSPVSPVPEKPTKPRLTNEKEKGSGTKIVMRTKPPRSTQT